MKRIAWWAVACLLLGGTAARADVVGDYVEARSCSVFAGACHYGGEYDNEGRDAVMAWHFTRGDYHGVSLEGLSAVAVVRAQMNLAEADAHRSAILYVPASATPAQIDAVKAVVGCRIERVVTGPIQFDRTADGAYAVQVPQTVSLSVKPLPDRACCVQPNLVWYQPLTAVLDRRVGMTEEAVTPDWSRHHENGAFYGTVSYH